MIFQEIYCAKTHFSGAVTVSLQGAFTADEQEEGLDGHDCVGGHIHAVDDVHVFDAAGGNQSFELEKKGKFVKGTIHKWAVTVSLQGAFAADEKEEGLDGHDCIEGHVHAVDDVHVFDATGSNQSFELD